MRWSWKGKHINGVGEPETGGEASARTRGDPAGDRSRLLLFAVLGHVGRDLQLPQGHDNPELQMTRARGAPNLAGARVDALGADLHSGQGQ